VIESGPKELADAAREWSRLPLPQRLERVRRSPGSRQSTPEQYLGRALLQPGARWLSRLSDGPTRAPDAGHCDACGGRPWIASRRPAGDADGSSRFLGCALCGAEWRLLRARCAACGEEDPARLPAFSSPEHPAARLEACETCRSYLKSIDLTVDARAVAEVDDLTSLALDFWAAGQGYERIEPGMAGVCGVCAAPLARADRSP
jgi:FdhE protein